MMVNSLRESAEESGFMVMAKLSKMEYLSVGMATGGLSQMVGTVRNA